MKGAHVVLAALIAAASFSRAAFAEMPAAYSTVIETYRRAMAERWEEDWDKLEEHGIPVEFRYGGEEPKIIAALVDVDADGSPELVIYDDVSRYMLWNAFTIKDGAAVRLFTGAGRNRWYLTRDGDAYLFENEGSSGASNSFNYYYSLKEGELVFEKGIIYDADEGGERSPWYRTTTDQRGRDNYVGLVPICEADAGAETAIYEASRIFPEGELIAK